MRSRLHHKCVRFADSISGIEHHRGLTKSIRRIEIHLSGPFNRLEVQLHLIPNKHSRFHLVGSDPKIEQTFLFMLWQLVEQLSRVPKKAKGRIIWNDGCRSRIYSKQYLTRRVYPFIVALFTAVVFTVVVFTVVVFTVVVFTVVVFTVVVFTVVVFTVVVFTVVVFTVVVFTVVVFTMVVFTMVVFTVVVIVMTVNVSKNLCFPLSILIHNLQINLTLRQDSQFLHFKE